MTIELFVRKEDAEKYCEKLSHVFPYRVVKVKVIHPTGEMRVYEDYKSCRVIDAVKGGEYFTVIPAKIENEYDKEYIEKLKTGEIGLKIIEE